MAQVDIPVSFSHLIFMCAERQITLDMSKKYTKWELSRILRDYFMENHIDRSKESYKSFALIKPYFDEISSPQLCYPYEHLNVIQKREIFHSSEWIFEKKLDGYRALLTYIDGKWDIWARSLDPTSFFPVYLTENVLFNLPDIEVDCILDVEIVPERLPESYRNTNDYLFSIFSPSIKENMLDIQENYPLSFHVFDVLMVGSTRLTDRPLIDRARDLEYILQQISCRQVCRVPRVHENRAQFLNQMIRNGFEGVVAKNVMAPYDTLGTRKRNHFVKIKRNYSLDQEILQFKDTVDGWISDVVTSSSGMITFIEVSALRDGKSHPIAKVPMPFSQQIPFLQFHKEEVTVDPMLGTVVEVDGTGWGTDGYLIDPILIRFRFDKTIDSCVLQ